MPKSVSWKVGSGVAIKADPARTTTILGSYDKDMKYIIRDLKYPKTYDFGAKKGGFNVLNTPNNAYSEKFWREHNKPFLDAAIKRGDRIVMATAPRMDVLRRMDSATGKWVLSGFGREYMHLRNNGYRYDAATRTMVKAQ